MNRLPKVLCCDDDIEFQKVLMASLKKHVDLTCSFSVSEAKSKVQQSKYDALLIDLNFEGQEEDGIALIDFMNRKFPEVYLIIVSGDQSTRRVVEAMRRRHFEFIPKGEDCVLELIGALTRAFERRNEKAVEIFITDSLEVKEVLAQMERVAISKVPGSCLILGETGTGKEVLATHFAQKLGLPLRAVNMAAIPEEIAESELFGHEKGAFTGASMRKIGAIEAAHGGLLFLDEVGECSPSIQAKLLRVIESKEVTPVGSTQSKKVNVRFIAATHADLELRCQSGEFRSDLYQRLSAFVFRLPPLRDRPSDVLLFAKMFLAEMSQTSPGFVLQESGCAELIAYSWPGNTRELKNVIGRLIAFSDSTRITGQMVRRAIRHGSELTLSSDQPNAALEIMAVEAMKDSHKRELVLAMLKRFNGNRRKAADFLKISESTIYRWIRASESEPAQTKMRSSVS